MDHLLHAHFTDRKNYTNSILISVLTQHLALKMHVSKTIFFSFHTLVIIIINFIVFRYLGQGLVTILDYKTWKPRRKPYDPAFNKG